MNFTAIFSLSKWFYLGIIGILIGGVLIYKSNGNNKSKTMENGYLLLVLGLIGVISEFTDFASVLLLFVVITGLVLLIDKLIISKRNPGIITKPHYVHYAREFFPVVLAVWVLRAFLFEAYIIPSSSMRPDLTVGDFILVNKFDYGIRMPVTNKVLIPINHVVRGDIVVFQDQEVRNRDLIKRVIGVPGDKINYQDKKLTINGQPLEYKSDGSYNYKEQTSQGEVEIANNQYIENLLGIKHKIIVNENIPAIFIEQVTDFPLKENCHYMNNNGFSCTVPAGHYFMMGDNRDNSLDSRYWGFVPEKAILGKAFLVWMNIHDLSRIGTKIK